MIAFAVKLFSGEIKKQDVIDDELMVDCNIQGMVAQL